MRRGTLTIKARYVYPMEGPPIEDGCVKIQQGRIAWVGTSDDRKSDLDLGDVGIVPGFVNAHTHLELEAISRRGLASGDHENEVSWLKHVVNQRRAGTDQSLRSAVARNVKASTDAGTTLLADTTTAGLS
jgi:aminodeoxyfutalosine deaminase